MSAADDAREIIALLRSIDAGIKALRGGVAPASGTSTAGGDIASDHDLDSKYGDPELKFLPRDWSGPQTYKGARFSECPADLLDMAAETFDYFARRAAENNEMTTSGKPVAGYKRLDAARARGWAKRIRNGYQPPTMDTGDAQHPDAQWPSSPPPQSGLGFDVDDDIAF